MDIYNTILYNPKEFLNKTTPLDFKIMCLECDILDLTELLKVFESHELYEWCSIIKPILDEKKNKIKPRES